VTWVELAGAVNVRDVGGLPTVDGRTTRSGVLLRADNLQGLTADDVTRLVDELRLRTVLDLRTDGEVHLEGPGPLHDRPEVVHHHLTLIPHGFDGRKEKADADAQDADAQNADEQDVDRAIPDEDQTGPELMTGYYVGYLADAPDNVATALRLLADPAGGTALVHCAAGKDRTGVIVALALSLAGVTREAVVADYVRTGERIEAIRDRLLASPTYAADLGDRSLDSMRPHAENMERFLDEVDRRYGGPHGLAMSVGVDEETVDRLRSRLVRSPR
jgi:protein-tyrosine phosphatase